MKVTIRLSTTVSYSVTIPDNSTVEDLRNSAIVACPETTTLPSDFKIIYKGEKLAPYYRSLDSFNIVPGSEETTVILMNNGTETPVCGSPVSSPSLEPVATVKVERMPKKSKKKSKCSFKNCSAAPLRMVGDCSHCNGKFCAKHRLLEDHMCQGLQSCKESAHEKNAMKLESEKTIVNKV